MKQTLDRCNEITTGNAESAAVASAKLKKKAVKLFWKGQWQIAKEEKHFILAAV
jgi:hypothetical protein